MDPLNKDDGSQPEALKSTGGAVDSIFKCEQTCTASASYIQTANETTTQPRAAPPKSTRKPEENPEKTGEK